MVFTLFTFAIISYLYHRKPAAPPPSPKLAPPPPSETKDEVSHPGPRTPAPATRLQQRARPIFSSPFPTPRPLTVADLGTPPRYKLYRLAGTPITPSSVASTPVSEIRRRWARIPSTPIIDLSIDREISTDLSTKYQQLLLLGYNSFVDKAPADLQDNVKALNFDPKPKQLILDLDDGDVAQLDWNEVLIARGYFEQILTSTQDDIQSLLAEEQPPFYGQSVLPFFRELSIYFKSNDPFEQFFFTELVGSFYQVQKKLLADPFLFSLAYPNVELVELSLDSPVASPGTPATPQTPTTRISISPLENDALLWGQNPVVQWLIYNLVSSEPNWEAFIKFSSDLYLDNFQRMVLYLYTHSKVDTRLIESEVAELRLKAVNHLGFLRNALVPLKDLQLDELKTKVKALTDEQRSQLFESYVFYKVLNEILPKTFEEICPDWQVNFGAIVLKLSSNDIVLQPQFVPVLPPPTPLSTAAVQAPR